MKNKYKAEQTPIQEKASFDGILKFIALFLSVGMVLRSCVFTYFLPKIFYFRGNMKIQVKIMAIFILFFALAVISCSPGNATYTVMYNGNTNTGGTVPIDTNTYLPTFTVTVLGNGTLTDTGYTFTCWNTQADGNGTDRAPASTFAIGSSNVVLYAKWTALPTYTVTYNNATGGNGVPPVDSNSYLAGATVTVPGSSYSVSWNTQADGSGTALAPTSTFAMGSSNVILYARCPVNRDYSSLSSLGGPPYGCTCKYLYAMQNGSCRLCTPPFTYTNGICTCVKTKTNNCITLAHTVSYIENGGSGDPPFDDNTYPLGATVTVLGIGTLTKLGYTFAGWNTQADGNGTDRAPASTFAMGSSNVVLYAKWTAI